MSTSLLYHGFGIVGYNYFRTDYREGNVIFTVSRKKFNLRCPVCKSKRIIKHGSLPRWFHTLPFGKKTIYIKTEVHRVECRGCKTIRQAEYSRRSRPPIPFHSGHRFQTIPASKLEGSDAYNQMVDKPFLNDVIEEGLCLARGCLCEKYERYYASNTN